MKKIVFFDVTGTLVYPKKTKNKENPGFLYSKYSKRADAYGYMTLTPHAKQTLLELKKKGIKRVVVSAVSDGTGPEEIRKMLKYFAISHLFDEIHTINFNTKGGKAPKVTSILNRLGISKKSALMVGDAYWADYRLVRDSGVDAVLFYSEWQRSIRPVARRVSRVIRDLNEIFKYI